LGNFFWWDNQVLSISRRQSMVEKYPDHWAQIELQQYWNRGWKIDHFFVLSFLHPDETEDCLSRICLALPKTILDVNNFRFQIKSNWYIIVFFKNHFSITFNFVSIIFLWPKHIYFPNDMSFDRNLKRLISVK
jgi:hypothetical protein